jgi:CheY-like chemotaxis protein
MPVEKLVLIADDHADSANMLATLVRINTGARTLIARDGDDAVKQWLTNRPAVVILDINMPVLDGMQAAEAIRSATSMPPMLVCISGNVELLTLAEAPSLFDHALGKPLNVQRLTEILHAAFRSERD